MTDAANRLVRKIAVSTGTVSTLAGDRTAPAGDADGVGTAARFRQPAGISTDGLANCYITDVLGHTIRRVSWDGRVTTIGGGSGIRGAAEGPGTESRFYAPLKAVPAPGGVIYAVDWNNRIIRGGAPSPQLVRNANGTVSLYWRTPPGSAYDVERSLNLKNWVVRASLHSRPDGAINYVDPAPPAGKAFYRLNPSQVIEAR